MIVYRIDLLDNEGKISSSERVVRQNDQEALRSAARMIGHHKALEIWDHTRVVGQVTSEECRRFKRRPARQGATLSHSRLTHWDDWIDWFWLVSSTCRS
jgi:hypothetical protein